MRVILFEPNWNSVGSVSIAIKTKTPFSHAMIEIDGKYYDASESRGTFDVASPEKFKNRIAHEWTMGNRIIVRKFIKQNLFKQCEYKGLIWRILSGKNPYCFEFTLALCKLAKNTDLELPKNSNGFDIIELLGTPNKIYKF